MGALEDLCRERRYDLVHAHGLHHPGNTARLLKRRAGLPFVVTSHGDIAEAGRMRQRRFRARCRKVLRRADAITHLSRAMEERARAFGVELPRSEVIPNGIDLAQWPRDPSPAAREAYVLGAGRLVAQKGFEILVDALAELRSGGFSGPSLVIAGEGEEREMLARRARSRGIPCVGSREDFSPELGPSLCLMGFTSGPAKVSLFREASAVALPSRHGEASPLVLLEALAAGVPVLASDIPSLRELVDAERTGLLVSPTRLEPWAAALRRVAGDAALRERTRASARLRLGQHDWPHLATRYANLYAEIL